MYMYILSFFVLVLHTNIFAGRTAHLAFLILNKVSRCQQRSSYVFHIVFTVSLGVLKAPCYRCLNFAREC